MSLYFIGKLEFIFENNVGFESKDQLGTFGEKTQRLKKTSASVPLSTGTWSQPSINLGSSAQPSQLQSHLLENGQTVFWGPLLYKRMLIRKCISLRILRKILLNSTVRYNLI
jgi:hypothetical protein